MDGEVVGWRSGWVCTHTTGRDLFPSWKQEDPSEGSRGQGALEQEGPLLPHHVQTPLPAPTRLLLGTFLAPSFSAFFLASSKSSFWPMLA